VLGRISTAKRLGGTISIDPSSPAPPSRASRQGWAGRSGIETLAKASCASLVARMTSAIREISIQRGLRSARLHAHRLRRRGPMHALAMAEEIGYPRVLVPRQPGNFSALGLSASDIKHDDVRTQWRPLREQAAPPSRRCFENMAGAARRSSTTEGFAPEQSAAAPLAGIFRFRGRRSS